MLRHKIIITQTENEIIIPVIGAPVARVQRHEADTLPLLIQQPLVLGAAVVDAEAVQLSIVVEVDEGAVLGGDDAGIEDAGGASDGASGGVVGGGFDVCSLGEVDDVEMAVDGGGGGLAVTGAGVAGEDEELGGG